MKVKRKMNEPVQRPSAPETTQPDEAFKQAARARMVVDAEKRQREQLCGQEINAALAEIAKKYNCAITFVEMTQSYPQQNGEVARSVRMGIQPIAQDEPVVQ